MLGSRQGPLPDRWGPSGPSSHLAMYRQVPPYPPPDGTEDSRRRASEEKEAFDEQRLILEAKQGDHFRRERLRNHFSHAAVLCIWCVASAMMMGFFIWVFHLVAPEAWQFLSAERISKLESIVTTGSVATLIAQYIKKQL
jgi:hypothetical protein